MALKLIGHDSVPSFIALSTDIVGNKITGASLTGKLVLTTDDGKWHIIKSDQTLADYTLPVSLSSSASSNIGNVGLLAGEAHIGQVGGNATTITNAPALTVHANYATGDFVGTSGVPITFTGCARVNAGTGLITSCMLIDYALQSVSGELWLFDSIVTPPADSAAWSLSDADMATCIGIIAFNTYYASALNSISFGIPASPINFKCGASVKELYGCFVTRGSPTYASGDLTFRLSVLQD